jgi:hypothetical protein
MSAEARTYLKTFASFMRDSGHRVRLNLREGTARWGNSTLTVRDTPRGLLSETRTLIR